MGAKLASCVAMRGRWQWGQWSITKWGMKQRVETVCPGERLMVVQRLLLKLYGCDPPSRCVPGSCSCSALC